jgi:hypothetical protein
VLGFSACQAMSMTCCSLSGTALAEQAVSAKVRQVIEVKEREGNRIFYLSYASMATAPPKD